MMPRFPKLQELAKNLYVRIGFAFVIVLTGAALLSQFYFAADDSNSNVVHTQDIGEITALAANKDRIEYLLLSKPLADFPRYIFKYTDSPQIHVVKVPSTSNINLEREVLLKHDIPYSIASEAYLAENKAVLEDGDAENGPLAQFGRFLERNAIGIIMLLLLGYVLFKGLPGMTTSTNVIRPDDLKGSMDDLVGMEDIKREVAHLEEMIHNRDLYQSHAIDKPFNVMLTGPAGTGKTKLAGYLAKKLNVPLIQAAGSGLENGYVGGGSKALNAIYKKACDLDRCVIFLDEAQSLFMPRGRGERKWDDDTANTLLSLLDGVKSKKGSNVIWVVASNFDDASTEMDEAMLRRFAVKINFRLPNKNERQELLKVFLSRKDPECIEWDNLNLDYVAQMTANLSPALIETVVDRASMIAIQEESRISTDVLFRAFERTAIGLTDRATTAEKDKQRERIALHELGHFFMQIDPYLRKGMSLQEVKEKSHLLKISTESVSKLGALGYVLSSNDDVHLHTLEELEQQVVQLYGGMAAEELFYGARGISTGSQNDIQKVTAILDMMVNRLSMYSNSKLDYRQLKKDSSPEDGIRQLEEKADELYNRTLEAMHAYKDIMWDVKNVLLERYVLSKDEMFDLLEDAMQEERKAA